jgi:acyl-coenzyme A synthetase/AMP-(fatty) acid ligase
MMDHFGGINTIFALLSSGSQIVTVKDRSIETVLDAIDRHKVKLLPTTPSFLSLMVASGLWKQKDLSSLERITYGTETMPETLLRKLCEIFPNCTLQQTYGLSELGVMKSKSKDNNSISVQLGGKGFEYQIRNGILWIKSDYAMEGYLNAASPFDKDGWMNTQDVVEQDGDYLIIKGRETDIINVGGQKVYPAEVENIIQDIEEVVDVVVFGETNVVLGQSVSCKVSLSQNSVLTTFEAKKKIRRTCKKFLAPYKVPAKIYFSSELVSGRQKKIRR